MVSSYLYKKIMNSKQRLLN